MIQSAEMVSSVWLHSTTLGCACTWQGVKYDRGGESVIPLAFFGSKLRTCNPSNDVARDSATYACPEREGSHHHENVN